MRTIAFLATAVVGQPKQVLALGEHAAVGTAVAAAAAAPVAAAAVAAAAPVAAAAVAAAPVAAAVGTVGAARWPFVATSMTESVAEQERWPLQHRCAMRRWPRAGCFLGGFDPPALDLVDRLHQVAVEDHVEAATFCRCCAGPPRVAVDVAQPPHGLGGSQRQAVRSSAFWRRSPRDAAAQVVAELSSRPQSSCSSSTPRPHRPHPSWLKMSGRDKEEKSVDERLST